MDRITRTNPARAWTPVQMPSPQHLLRCALLWRNQKQLCRCRVANDSMSSCYARKSRASTQSSSFNSKQRQGMLCQGRAFGSCRSIELVIAPLARIRRRHQSTIVLCLTLYSRGGVNIVNQLRRLLRPVKSLLDQLSPPFLHGLRIWILHVRCRACETGLEEVQE